MLYTTPQHRSLPATSPAWKVVVRIPGGMHALARPITREIQRRSEQQGWMAGEVGVVVVPDPNLFSQSEVTVISPCTEEEAGRNAVLLREMSRVLEDTAEQAADYAVWRERE